MMPIRFEKHVSFAGKARPVKTFLLLWLGQVISLFGSGLTGFALAVWVYQETGQATQYALLMFFSICPEILISPLAGPLADRWDRRMIMMIGDAGAALMSLILILMIATHKLNFPILYLTMIGRAIFGAFQWPAFAATMPLLIPKDQLVRFNGLDQFGKAGSQILAPVVGGLLVGIIGLLGVLMIDLITFGLAILSLWFIRLPKPRSTKVESDTKSSFLNELLAGWHFLNQRKGLYRLLFFLALINLLAGVNMALAPALVLSSGSSTDLGWVLGASSAGVLIGSLVQTHFGGPKKIMFGVVGFSILYGMAFMMIGFRPHLNWIAIASFFAFFMAPQINGCSQLIWQTKVPETVQGRVFALRRFIAQGSLPLALLFAGVLADSLFDPLLLANGALAEELGWILGVGPGRGIGLIYVLLGGGVVLACLWTLRDKEFLRLEKSLPDEIITSQEASL